MAARGVAGATSRNRSRSSDPPCVERDGNAYRTFRLALKDGTVLDVSRDDAGGPWSVDHEIDDASAGA